METYFSEYQQFLISEDSDLIGFINTIPFQFNQPWSELPDTGWDWMLEKSILDYEVKLKPNYVGALQVVVRKKYQNQGYSKVILKQAKQILKDLGFEHLVIPIRPTLKHLHPNMSMDDYIDMKAEKKIYDPWIRTHIMGGAEIIKVCNWSMTVVGEIKLWEQIMGKILANSGEYILEGALTPITIDVENNRGEYIEPNIWIRYSF